VAAVPPAGEPRLERRPRQELVTGGDFLHLEGRPVRVVIGPQFVDEAVGLRRVGEPGHRGQAARRQGLVGREQGRFEPGELRRAAAGLRRLADRVVLDTTEGGRERVIAGPDARIATRRGAEEQVRATDHGVSCLRFLTAVE
jgi:hypothetical protein